MRSAEEAAARLTLALGIKSYPVQSNEVARLTTWLKERQFSPGELGKALFCHCMGVERSMATFACLVRILSCWGAVVRV